MYVFLAAPPFGLTGLDWVWIGISVVLDLSQYGGVYTQRGQMRGTPPPPA